MVKRVLDQSRREPARRDGRAAETVGRIQNGKAVKHVVADIPAGTVDIDPQ